MKTGALRVAALAVEDAKSKNGFRIYVLEEGAFKRKGTGWLSTMGKSVEIKGSTRQDKERNVLKVDGLEVISIKGPQRSN